MKWDGTIVTLEELFAKFHATETVVVYRCIECAGETVTVQRDPGVLPEAIACRASGSILECRGRSELVLLSMLKDRPRTPAWEWYDPHPIAGPSTENRAVEFAARVLQIRSIRVREIQERRRDNADVQKRISEEVSARIKDGGRVR